MEVTVTKCDACKREMNDYHVEDGCINLELNSISITQGLNNAGKPLNSYYSAANESMGNKHFCNTHCLVMFVNKIHSDGKLHVRRNQIENLLYVQYDKNWDSTDILDWDEQKYLVDEAIRLLAKDTSYACDDTLKRWEQISENNFPDFVKLDKGIMNPTIIENDKVIDEYLSKALVRSIMLPHLGNGMRAGIDNRTYDIITHMAKVFLESGKIHFEFGDLIYTDPDDATRERWKMLSEGKLPDYVFCESNNCAPLDTNGAVTTSDG